jgi:hypothetical protein
MRPAHSLAAHRCLAALLAAPLRSGLAARDRDVAESNGVVLRSVHMILSPKYLDLPMHVET